MQKQVDATTSDFDGVVDQSEFKVLGQQIDEEDMRLQCEEEILEKSSDHVESGMRDPLIIGKSDGGFTYGTSDMATLPYRIDEQHSERLICVLGDGVNTASNLVNAYTNIRWMERRKLTEVRNSVLHIDLQHPAELKLSPFSSEIVKIHESRILLCAATAKVMKCCFDIQEIRAIERM
ncbi:hypothetical protein Aperf_G00000000552 [Anoplocephala perfoliata]